MYDLDIVWVISDYLLTSRIHVLQYKFFASWWIFTKKYFLERKIIVRCVTVWSWCMVSYFPDQVIMINLNCKIVMNVKHSLLWEEWDAFLWGPGKFILSLSLQSGVNVEVGVEGVWAVRPNTYQSNLPPAPNAVHNSVPNNRRGGAYCPTVPQPPPLVSDLVDKDDMKNV